MPSALSVLPILSWLGDTVSTDNTACALLASSGFAHRVAPIAVDESLTAYLAAGGSLSELCVDTGEDGAAVAQSCDACRLVDSVALPVAASGCADAGRRVLATLGGFDTSAPAPAVFDPARPARAPPVV